MTAAPCASQQRLKVTSRQSACFASATGPMARRPQPDSLRPLEPEPDRRCIAAFAACDTLRRVARSPKFQSNIHENSN